MQDFSHNLINLHNRQDSSNQSSVIFGTAASLSQSLETRQRVRIGMWPCISSSEPNAAMGMFTVLALLLERWPDIRAYPVFVKLEGKPTDYKWSVEQSQFEVDDWEMEYLDENVALWGKLESIDGKWQLIIDVENDIGDERVEKTFTYDGGTLSELVGKLPTAAQDIAEIVEADDISSDVYGDVTTGEDTLRVLLSDLFQWQLNLHLSLWGTTWDIDTIRIDLNKLTVSGGNAGVFGAWCVSNAVAQAMLPGYGEEINDFVAFNAANLVDKFSDTAFSYIAIGSALYGMGRVGQAYDLLEEGVEAHSDNVALWNRLANLYHLGGQIDEAIDTYQRAIEIDAVNVALYRRYAYVLGMLDDDKDLEEFILIDPDDYANNLVNWEFIEAYEEAIKLEPENITLLRQQLIFLISMFDEERLWKRFETLLKLDKEGDSVRAVVDTMDALENREQAIEIVKKQIETTGERVDLYVNLATLYLIDEDGDLAVGALEKAEKLTEDEEILADISRMMLSAEDPEFELRLGEISTQVTAGNDVKAEDANFLENIIEKAPLLTEAYVLLAKTYIIWEEDGDALDVLLDGHKIVPEEPEIIENLARVLWKSGEKELTFEYLNKGIAANPTYVALLALAGLYLAENGQDENAKEYLMQAEAISPRNPVLTQVRASIARMMQKKDDE
jgi:tetratricopeptide (TPR) repeat protein